VRRAEAALAAAEARLGSGQDLDLRKFDVETTASVREARALVAEARLTRDRVESMVQQNAQSGAQLDTAAAVLAVAESRLQRALDEARTNLADVAMRRVEREQAQKRAADSRVVAPWPGRVAVRHATAGQVLGVGAPIVTLLRVDPLRLQLRLPDRLTAEVAAGQLVEFTVDGGGDTVHGEAPFETRAASPG
jgi:membrane fusion protein (multidrug efflux system)